MTKTIKENLPALKKLLKVHDVENLNYALSYEADNAYALYLMGRLQAEQFGDYEKAKQYYAEALVNKLDFAKVYPKYILAMIWNQDYDEAQKYELPFDYKEQTNRSYINDYSLFFIKKAENEEDSILAITYLDEAREVVEFLVNEKKAQGYQSDLAEIYTLLTNAHFKTNNSTEALKYFKKAKAVYQKLISEKRCVPFYEKEIEALKKMREKWEE